MKKDWSKLDAEDLGIARDSKKAISSTAGASTLKKESVTLKKESAPVKKRVVINLDSDDEEDPGMQAALRASLDDVSRMLDQGDLDRPAWHTGEPSRAKSEQGTSSAKPVIPDNPKLAPRPLADTSPAAPSAAGSEDLRHVPSRVEVVHAPVFSPPRAAAVEPSQLSEILRELTSSTAGAVAASLAAEGGHPALHSPASEGTARQPSPSSCPPGEGGRTPGASPGTQTPREGPSAAGLGEEQEGSEPTDLRRRRVEVPNEEPAQGRHASDGSPGDQDTVKKELFGAEGSPGTSSEGKRAREDGAGGSTGGSAPEEDEGPRTSAESKRARVEPEATSNEPNSKKDAPTSTGEGAEAAEDASHLEGQNGGGSQASAGVSAPVSETVVPSQASRANLLRRKAIARALQRACTSGEGGSRPKRKAAPGKENESPPQVKVWPECCSWPAPGKKRKNSEAGPEKPVKSRKSVGKNSRVQNNSQSESLEAGSPTNAGEVGPGVKQALTETAPQPPLTLCSTAGPPSQDKAGPGTKGTQGRGREDVEESGTTETGPPSGGSAHSGQVEEGRALQVIAQPVADTPGAVGLPGILRQWPACPRNNSRPWPTSSRQRSS
jgi:hypothetical protein